VCSATIKISKDNVIFTTKNASSSATGSGKTSIATSAMIPNGKKIFTNFGEIPLKPIDCNRSILILPTDVNNMTI
jgi:hypothetical protein